MYLLIPTHNRSDKLADLLESIVAADHTSAIDAVFIIENGSKVASEVASRFAEQLPIKYLQLDEGNKSKALNEATRHISADTLLVFFDDDILIDKNLFKRYATVCPEYGPGHYFGGGHRPNYEEEPDPSLVPYFPRGNRFSDLAEGMDSKLFAGFQDFLGFNWACYHQDLIDIGGFSPEFGPGSKSGARGQETDAQYRMAANGVKAVAIGNALVDHWVPSKFVQPDWLVERIFLSSIHLGKENPGLIKSLGLMAKLLFSLFQYALGNRSIGPRYRIAKAAGYLKGLVS